MDRVRGQPGPFKTVEAIQVPQEIPKQFDTASGTGLQETTVHIPSSDLGEG